MSSLFDLPVDWQALATLVTGVAAVSGAVYVATLQNTLRRDEVRVSLLNSRREVIKTFDRLNSEWWSNARLSKEGIDHFSEIIREIELVFDDEAIAEAKKIFDNTYWQKVFDGRMESYRQVMNDEKYQDLVEKNSELEKQLCERLPKMRQLLISSARVGHIFR